VCFEVKGCAGAGGLEEQALKKIMILRAKSRDFMP
jgi:hypothetical protein